MRLSRRKIVRLPIPTRAEFRAEGNPTAGGQARGGAPGPRACRGDQSGARRGKVSAEGTVAAGRPALGRRRGFQEQSSIRPVLSSAGVGVTLNALDLDWLSTGWPASRHPRTVSKMISTEAEAV